MADLFSILSQASGSLSAHRNSAATASHNLSNANTPGFARQRAELQAMLPAEMINGGFIGRGAGLLTVSQARDRFIEAQIPGSMGQAAFSSAHSAALQGVSALDPDGGAGLTKAIGDFYGSLRALSQNPSDPGLRQVALSTARSMSQAFNRASQSIEAAKSGIDAKLTGTVAEANTLAANIADLNNQIQVARASGGEPNDLLDARLSATDRLATLTGAKPVPDAKGNVSMLLANGTALVNENRAATLSLLPNAANGGHLAVQLTRTDGTGPMAMQQSEFGGEAGGLLAARDTTLDKAAKSLDTLAFDLGNAINLVHRTGFALDGTTGRDLLVTGATSAGAAGRLAVDPTVDANPSLLGAASSAGTVPGDGTALLALIGTETQALSTGLDASGALSNLISDFGASASRLAAAAQHDGALLDNVTAMRESVSGVSIDEEMINLTKAQRSFEAVMKVMKTTDEMLQTLLSLK